VLENQERVGAAIEQTPWTGVVFDVLRDYSVDDLNCDWGMQGTLAMIGRLTRKKNPHCIPVIIHHARPGKLGAASAVGFDRGGFGRNSKVLLGWARAQINVAPYETDNNDVLVIASAKCNNAEEFRPFAVRLASGTKFYHRDDSIDIDEWKERVGSKKPSNKKITIADVVKFVEAIGLDGIEKQKLSIALQDLFGVSRATAYRAIEEAESTKGIVCRKTDDLFVVPKPSSN
jgi:hypothetical protein